MKWKFVSLRREFDVAARFCIAKKIILKRRCGNLCGRSRFRLPFVWQMLETFFWKTILQCCCMTNPCACVQVLCVVENTLFYAGWRMGSVQDGDCFPWILFQSYQYLPAIFIVDDPCSGACLCSGFWICVNVCNWNVILALSRPRITLTLCQRCKLVFTELLNWRYAALNAYYVCYRCYCF